MFVLTVVAVMFGAVALHAQLAQRQGHLDGLRVRLAEAERTHERLRLDVATLQSPLRIVAAADRMGLRPPIGIVFLPPVDVRIQPGPIGNLSKAAAQVGSPRTDESTASDPATPGARPSV